MKCLFLLPTLLLAVSGTTTCKTGSDCSMNGICYVDRCVCEAGWTGTHCDQMSLKPANLKGGYDSPHNGGKTSSWGGGILKINGTFHMYAAEMMNFCGIESWEPNSRVVHATSKNAVGPYTFQSEVLKPFAHEPNVVMSPTGEIVIYVTLRHPDGYELANCTEPEPIVPFAPEPPGPCGTPPPRSTYMIYSSNPYGPWSEPELVLKANDSKWANCPVMVDTNLAVAIREDGSALGIWRKCTNKPGKCESDCCTFPHLLHASDWKDPSTYVPSPVPMFPNMAAYGSEDPFVWIDETFNTTFHAIFHDEQGVSRTSSNGYHAFSIDNGNTWTYASNAAYNASVVTTNGTVQFARRERPHLILENGIPTHVTNGVQEDDAPTNCHEDAQCYRSYTLIQAFNEHIFTSGTSQQMVTQLPELISDDDTPIREMSRDLLNDNDSSDNSQHVYSSPQLHTSSRRTWEDDDDYFGQWDALSPTTVLSTSPLSISQETDTSLYIQIKNSPIELFNGSYSYTPTTSVSFYKKIDEPVGFLYQTKVGFWMLTDAEDDVRNNVGFIRSSERYLGTSLCELFDISERISWNVFNDGRWLPSLLKSCRSDSSKFHSIHTKHRPYPGELVLRNPVLATLSGSYFINNYLTVSTPVWSTLDSACYLYMTTTGYWMITDDVKDINSNTGFVRSNQVNFTSPSDVSVWLVNDNGHWVVGKGIEITIPR